MKEAKDKAEELILKFKTIDSENYNVNLKNAIKFALICVDEMIIQNGELYLNGIDSDYYRKVNFYLFDVKQEILNRQ